MVHLQRWLSQEVLFGIQDLVDINFKVLAELRRQLVDASDQCVAKCFIRLPSITVLSRARSWREVCPFHAVVQIKPVHAASDASLTGVERLHGQIEEITGKPSIVWHRIEATELNALNAFGILRVLQLLLDAPLNRALRQTDETMLGTSDWLRAIEYLLFLRHSCLIRTLVSLHNTHELLVHVTLLFILFSCDLFHVFFLLFV